MPYMHYESNALFNKKSLSKAARSDSSCTFINFNLRIMRTKNAAHCVIVSPLGADHTLFKRVTWSSALLIKALLLL